MTAQAASPQPCSGGLAEFLTSHPGGADLPLVHTEDGSATLGEVTAAARVLAGKLGPVAGAAVACVVDDGLRAVTAMFATWLAGGIYVPVNGRLTPAEARAQLAAAGPAAVVAGPGGQDKVPRQLNLLVEEPRGIWVPYRSGLAPATRRFTGDEAIILRTSGTTGDPKPVLLHHAGVRDGIDTVIARLRGGREPSRDPMPNLIPTSMALWAGIWNTLFAFRTGAPVILLNRFDPATYAELVRRFGIRSTVLAPAMMTMLTEAAEITDLAPLRYVRSVTAPLTPDQARRFHARFGVDVLNSYGQTELGSEVAGWTAADIREFGAAKLGAVGRAHPGIAIRILGEDLAELSPDSTGEIWIRSPFATDDDGSGRVVDGFLRTGDLGRLDDDGFLWIEGRVSDMINRGGLKIVPQEVEEALRRHPGVADACVAGVPDARLGEVPVAWIRARPGAEPGEPELLAFVRESLSGYKTPVAVRFVDDFPRTEIGKVLRRVLAAGFENGQPTDGTESREVTQREAEENK
jgi:acyl-coenzyme A synthetase/AMP-(fatty) acid ligase